MMSDCRCRVEFCSTAHAGKKWAKRDAPCREILITRGKFYTLIKKMKTGEKRADVKNEKWVEKNDLSIKK